MERIEFQKCSQTKTTLCVSHARTHTHTHKHSIKVARCVQTIPFQWTTQYIKLDCISWGKRFRGDVRSRCRLSSLFFLLARKVLY